MAKRAAFDEQPSCSRKLDRDGDLGFGLLIPRMTGDLQSRG